MSIEYSSGWLNIEFMDGPWFFFFRWEGTLYFNQGLVLFFWSKGLPSPESNGEIKNTNAF